MVYVDNMQAGFGRMIMCHMIADTTEELLEMADKIGVNRKWIQYPGTYQEHFDICQSKKKKAIALGAKHITMRELAAITMGRKDKPEFAAPDKRCDKINQINMKKTQLNPASFPLNDGKVFPSEEVTVYANPDPIYGGAHLYEFKNCLGFNGGKTDYDHSYQEIQFIHKADDGTITPGVQSEQLVIALIDRHEKLNARFPSPQNEKMIAGLKMFLEACRERVQERMDRGVMGDLKK